MAFGKCEGCQKFKDNLYIVFGQKVCEDCLPDIKENQRYTGYMQGKRRAENRSTLDEWNDIKASSIKEGTIASKRSVDRNLTSFRVKTAEEYRAEDGKGAELCSDLLSSIRDKEQKIAEKVQVLSVETKLQKHREICEADRKNKKKRREFIIFSDK